MEQSLQYVPNDWAPTGPLSEIRQSHARGSTTNDPARRAAEEPCNAPEHPGTVAARQNG